jgi:hypothetical protein
VHAFSIRRLVRWFVLLLFTMRSFVVARPNRQTHDEQAADVEALLRDVCVPTRLPQSQRTSSFVVLRFSQVMFVFCRL